jgi:hypothetical protein
LKRIAESQTLKRPRFFEGQLLTAADLQLEQQYVIEKHKLHNRALHGFGIVSGLKVTVAGRQIIVAPGLAIDCEGNDLVVDSEQTLAVSGLGDLRIAYLGLRYVEKCVDPVPAATGDEERSRIQESFELAFAAENSNRGHRHSRGRWLPCGQPHAFTIAKLRAITHGWRVERRYRPPTMK